MVTFSGIAAADGRGQAVQEHGTGHGGDLEDVHGAQEGFRQFNAPASLAKVYAGARYEDGIEVTEKGVAA